MKRQLSKLDSLIINADRVVKTLSRESAVSTVVSPADQVESDPLSVAEEKHAAGLMRVNHSGEVMAQALYQGQALTAKSLRVKQDMLQAAREEQEHLAWCEERVGELDSHTSVLNPLWYGLSFGMGAAAGLVSDRVSLGLVAAIEDQVCEHLEEHLQVLPSQDHKSRAIVSQMLVDEAKHSQTARVAGGVNFPAPIKSGMTALSRLMTKTSYRW